jgi:hypothetical protein
MVSIAEIDPPSTKLAKKLNTENGVWLVLNQITTFNISLVVHGTCAEVNELKNVSTPVCSP